jgi:hypothetical protein
LNTSIADVNQTNILQNTSKPAPGKRLFAYEKWRFLELRKGW